MASKTTMKNAGVPLWVNPKTDLPAKEGSNVDSWYFVCNCEVDGKKIGFQWHQQSMVMPNGMKFGQAEIEMMDAETQNFVSDVVIAPTGEILDSDYDKLNVYSPVGQMTGDAETIHLKAQCKDGSFDVEIKTRHVLYNGVVGLLKLMGNSYQFSFTDVLVNGELELGGVKYQVKDAIGWIDRQWDMPDAKGSNELMGGGMLMPAWLWIGMALNEDGAAVSLWDSFAGVRNSFATVAHENGVQTIVPIDVTYEETWTSERTGAVYPRKFRISIPQEDIELYFDSLLDKPEVVVEQSGIHGSQNLCHVTGHYKDQVVERDVIVELVGDICGEMN